MSYQALPRLYLREKIVRSEQDAELGVDRSRAEPGGLQPLESDPERVLLGRVLEAHVARQVASRCGRRNRVDHL